VQEIIAVLKDLISCRQLYRQKLEWRKEPHASHASTVKVWPSGQMMPSAQHSCNRKIATMDIVIRPCALLLMALTGWTEPALARSYLNCLTKKVVVIDAPSGSTSSSVEEHSGFWIDETAKTLVLADGTPLTVHRFDDHWISAVRGDMLYELDRQSGNLTYAGSTTKDGAATITIGSGRCEIAPGPAR
jgi:hypothetical protein